MPNTTEDQFSRLRALKESIMDGCTKHDLAIILISECIHNGITTGPKIIETLGRLGLNEKHAGITLRTNCGDQPAGNHWKKQADGTYALHPETSE